MGQAKVPWAPVSQDGVRSAGELAGRPRYTARVPYHTGQVHYYTGDVPYYTGHVPYDTERVIWRAKPVAGRLAPVCKFAGRAPVHAEKAGLAGVFGLDGPQGAA